MDFRSFHRQRWVNLQFFVSVVVGWYICKELFSPDGIFRRSVGLQSCIPCTEATCEKCESGENIVRRTRNLDVENSYFRKYPYSPLSVSEDILQRWRVVTRDHTFEELNGEPRIGLNGMWRLEREAVERRANLYMKDDLETEASFKGMLRRTDPFTGTNYYVRLHSGSSNDGKSHLVQMQRGFYGSKPHLIEVTNTGKKEMLTIISPVSIVTNRFHYFLKRFKETVLNHADGGSGDIKLLFVIFESPEGEESTTKLLDALDEFRTKHPNALVEHLLTQGNFNRALGLHTGVQNCKSDDLMLFIDIDMHITTGFFERIRKNTVQHKYVYFPVTYSQYDPEIISDASQISAIANEIETNVNSINESTGYWIHYAFGIVSMYRSDYEKVGGFKLDITGWGGEDVDLYRKFIADPDIEVFNAVDRDLIHVYHSRGCDPNLDHDQYRMCVGAWSETLGSQMEVAGVYLKNTKNEMWH